MTASMRLTKASVFAALALLAGSLLVVNAGPAHAAYPGENGRIVMVGDGGYGTWDVITVDPDGTNRVNLTQGAFDADYPAWSPDGTKIAFSVVVGSPSGCGRGDIYVMDADGSDLTPLTTNPLGVAAYDPTWSPDGSEIAFTRAHQDSLCNGIDVDIWKMNSDGSGQVLLAAGTNDFGPADDSQPAWSPDGDRIAFRSDRNNADWASNDQIYTMDPDGSNVVQVTHQDFHTFERNYLPAWSPDGEQLVFQHFPFRPPEGVGSSQISLINEDGTGETAVTSNGMFNMSPAWSPDGQRILFNAQFEDPPGEFNNDIFSITPAGTNQTNITNTGLAKDRPDWQPIVQSPAPAPPTFVDTDPDSPADDNTPRVKGTAVGAVTVTLYATADCSGPAAAQGSAADFASPGLPVSVPDNSTTTFHGTATDGAANTSACSTSSITYVEDSVPDDLVVSDCDDPALASVTTIEGDLIAQDLADCQSLSLPALTDASGVLIMGNPDLDTVNLASLATVAGNLTIAGNGSGDLDLTSLETVSGNLTLGGDGSGDLDLASLETVSGDLTISDTGSATVNLAEGGTVGGDLTIVDNDTATVNIAAGGTVGGDLTIVDNGTASVNIAADVVVSGSTTLEGQGAGELELPGTSGDLILDASGYDAIVGTTAGGATSLSNADGQAVMRVVLPDGTFEAPVAFGITRLQPATLAPEEGTGGEGEAATVDPLAAYSFEFAVPVLGLDATLTFDVLLAGLDDETRTALLAALDEGTATLVTKGGDAGDTYQAFPLCVDAEVPTAEGCVLVEQLDADGQPTTEAPAIVRFTGVTGHFSTWGVALVEPVPSSDTTPPVIAPHDDVTVEATGPTGATVGYTAPTASDDVDGSVAVSCAPATGSVFPLGTTPVTCSAQDAAGNQATSGFDVIVSDTTAPTIDAPTGITVDATGPDGAAVSFTATATDAVDGVTSAACAPPSGSLFPVGVTQVECTAADAAGNAATPASFAVTVNDVPDPVEQLEDLLHDVETSSIQRGLRLDLANKLAAAIKVLQKTPPDVVVACDKLEEFARKVELESSKAPPKIPAAIAAAWLTTAADIRSRLGC